MKALRDSSFLEIIVFAVLAVIAVIALCLVHVSHSFGSQAKHHKPASCKSQPCVTVFNRERKIMRRRLKQYESKLIEKNLSLATDPSCNITKAIKLEDADKPVQIYKRYYFGIKIFRVTAKKFSELTTKNASKELLQQERKLYNNLQFGLNLMETELLECFTQFKFYNQTKKFYELQEKTEARALKFSDKCFLISNLSYQRSHNNIIYYKQLNKFLRINPSNKFNKTCRSRMQKKEYKYTQTQKAGKPKKTSETDIIDERHKRIFI